MIVLLHRLLQGVRARPFTTAFVAIAVLTAAANAYLWVARTAAEREHEELRQHGQAVLSALADRERILADLAALDQALGQIDRHLASEQSMEVNLGYLYRIEKLARVRLDRIDQLVSAPAAAGAPYKAVPVSLHASGSYRNLLGFLRELETGPRPSRVRDYRLERSGDGELLLQLTVELLAFP